MSVFMLMLGFIMLLSLAMYSLLVVNVTIKRTASITNMVTALVAVFFFVLPLVLAYDYYDHYTDPYSMAYITTGVSFLLLTCVVVMTTKLIVRAIEFFIEPDEEASADSVDQVEHTAA